MEGKDPIAGQDPGQIQWERKEYSWMLWSEVGCCCSSKDMKLMEVGWIVFMVPAEARSDFIKQELTSINRWWWPEISIIFLILELISCYNKRCNLIFSKYGRPQLLYGSPFQQCLLCSSSGAVMCSAVLLWPSNTAEKMFCMIIGLSLSHQWHLPFSLLLDSLSPCTVFLPSEASLHVPHPAAEPVLLKEQSWQNPLLCGLPFQ